MCRVWRQYLDPDGVLPDEEAAFLKRGFTFGRERGGLVPVRGALTVEVAALLGRLFDAANSPRTGANPPRTDANPHTPETLADVHADADAAMDAGGATAPVGSARSGGSGVRFAAVSEREGSGSGTGITGDAADSFAEGIADERTPGQRRHDALAVLLATVARSAETPLLGGAPVTVLLQASEADLIGSCASNPDDGDPSDSGVNRAGASLSGGAGTIHGHDGTPAPVSMRVVRHAACAGATQRVVQSRSGRIMSIGVPQRVFNAHQRRAITLRDGGCVIPGCTTPATWCEIHHVTEHASGGRTHTDNGVMLCWFHHRTIETSGWQVRMNGGVPEVRAPAWLDHGGRWRRARPPGSPISHPPELQRHPDVMRAA